MTVSNDCTWETKVTWGKPYPAPPREEPIAFLKAWFQEWIYPYSIECPGSCGWWSSDVCRGGGMIDVMRGVVNMGNVRLGAFDPSKLTPEQVAKLEKCTSNMSLLTPVSDFAWDHCAAKLGIDPADCTTPAGIRSGRPKPRLKCICGPERETIVHSEGYLDHEETKQLEEMMRDSIKQGLSEE